MYPFLNLLRLGVEVDFIPHERGTVTLKKLRFSPTYYISDVEVEQTLELVESYGSRG